MRLARAFETLVYLLREILGFFVADVIHVGPSSCSHQPSLRLSVPVWFGCDQSETGASGLKRRRGKGRASGSVLEGRAAALIWRYRA